MRTYILNSTFLRGLGSGMIIAALLMFAWPTKEALTEDEIIQQAKKLGMEFQQSDQVEKDTKGATKGSDQPDAGTSNTGQLPPSNQNSGTTQVPPVIQPPQSVLKQVTITIPKGSNTSDIAETLLKSGLIKDKKRFLDLVSLMNVATKFKTGTFTLNTGMETTDILLQLTRK